MQVTVIHYSTKKTRAENPDLAIFAQKLPQIQVLKVLIISPGGLQIHYYYRQAIIGDEYLSYHGIQ